ncbi:hypothetical protein L218DRAFT_944890 [Marasmius fiardii PR-910]|nr:hypothetical protein L218DRAFT_944890 [Marasmius fiardii PR-910]
MTRKLEGPRVHTVIGVSSPESPPSNLNFTGNETITQVSLHTVVDVRRCERYVSENSDSTTNVSGGMLYSGFDSPALPSSARIDPSSPLNMPSSSSPPKEPRLSITISALPCTWVCSDLIKRRSWTWSVFWERWKIVWKGAAALVQLADVPVRERQLKEKNEGGVDTRSHVQVKPMEEGPQTSTGTRMVIQAMDTLEVEEGPALMDVEETMMKMKTSVVATEMALWITTFTTEVYVSPQRVRVHVGQTVT